MEEGLIQRTSVYISSRAHLNLSFNLCESGITTFLMGGTLQREAEDAFILQYVNRGKVLLSDDRMSFRISAGQGFFVFPDMQIFVRNASVEEIRAHVDALIQTFAPGGGFVFTQVHNIQYDVPPEKVLAIYETAAKYRAPRG